MPEEGTIFDKVEFIELPLDEAKPVIEQYNKEGKAAQPPDTKRFRGNDRDRYSSGSRSFGGRYGMLFTGFHCTQSYHLNLDHFYRVS